MGGLLLKEAVVGEAKGWMRLEGWGEVTRDERARQWVVQEGMQKLALQHPDQADAIMDGRILC